MQKILEKYIVDNQLFTKNHKLLLAVSGGLDSVVLAKCLTNLGYDFGIAHCNFQLRGVESDGDEVFVRQLAESYKVTVHVGHFDTKSYAKKHKISTQMAARELRYAWFEQVRSEFNYDFLVTAHHQNDQIETILLNIVRGTGLAGLRGMLPKNQNLVRPMLCLGRTEIENFAKAHNLAWREDSSNASDDYQRNLLRHKVVPILEQMNPNLGQSITKMASVVHSAEVFIHEQPLAMTTIKERFGLAVEGQIIDLHNVGFERLGFYLNDLGLNFEQIANIWTARNSTEAKIFLTENHHFELSRGELLVLPKQNSPNYYLIEKEDVLKNENLPVTFEIDELPIYNRSHSINIDFDSLVFPLTLRRWQQGDWFCPMGMKGKKKKISDFLTDQKLPSILKKQVWIVESEQKIVGIVGFRGDERFGVSGKTKKILKIFNN